MDSHEDLTRIEIDQFFPHPPEKLWRALTTSELMAQWLMPNDFEPVVGHRFTFESQPVAQADFSGKIACQVLDLDPEKLLQISWADAEKPEGMITTVTWTLEPEGNGTRLFLEHAGFDPDENTQQLARKFMGGGWRSQVLRSFGEFLDTLE